MPAKRAEPRKRSVSAAKAAEPPQAKPATVEQAGSTESKRDTSRESANLTRVVAIGASAGGLEPMEKFFDGISTDSGLAFVIIQHLSPDFRSMMDQLLARHSTMMIVHAENRMKLEPNVVYLNPPRTDLTIKGGRLYTRNHENAEVPSLPIDSFFNSLATDQKENAIGIVMSGTGSDGSRGGHSIRGAGGTLIVQEPASAKFDSMPRAALERGAASVVAKPEEMPELLMRLIAGEDIDQSDAELQDGVDPERVILSLLQRRYGADFGYYKHATVRRRIRRRALLSHHHSIENYLAMLKENTEELEALYCDLLIGVTAFFRDGEAYDRLRDKVLPNLASKMSADNPLRVWVAGCASGEEPYSIAILISEFARRRGLTPNVKIFATDIHFNSLEVASAGMYPKESLKGMPAELIDEYFDVVDNQYCVKQNLRKLVVFSPHNIIKDPPFTRMDLVTCRNLLIYLDDIAQRKVLAFFHFALRKDGILFLGPSETTGDLGNEFQTISKKWRIFKKIRDVRLRESTELLPISSTDSHEDREETRLTEVRSPSLTSLQNATVQRQTLLRAYDKMLEKFAPASLLVDRDGELIHIFGHADRFLHLKSGVFSKKIVDVLIPELKLIVSAGLERALAQHTVPFVRKTPIANENGTDTQVKVGVEKLSKDGNYAEFLLVTIEEMSQPEFIPSAPDHEENADSVFYSQRVAELERDLKVTEESLQSTIEELETSNEELQATNEELMASNEELQSTNEELHSVNEELYTVSAEHQRKIEELTELTEDMDNLLRATDIGTVFVDSEHRIRRFTPAAAQTFNLVSHDIGRPLEHITYRFSYDGLTDDVERVRLDGRSMQQQIEVDGRPFLLRILPYRSEREEHTGAVLTVVDIEEVQKAQRELAKQRRLYEQVVEEQSDLICRYTTDFKLTFVNEAYCAFYGKSRDELIGISVLDLTADDHRDIVSAKTAELKAGRSDVLDSREIDLHGKQRWLNFTRYAQPGADGEIAEIQSVGRDITELKQAQDALEQLNAQLVGEQERLTQIYRTTPVMLHSVLEDGEIVEVSDYWCKRMGYTHDQVMGRSIFDFMTSESADLMRSENVEKLFGTEGAVDNIHYTYVKKDGSEMEVRVSATTAHNTAGDRTQSFSVVFDVTEQINAERTLAEQNAELARINENLNQFAHIVSHDLTGPLRAIEHTTNWIEQDSPPSNRKEIQEHIERLKDQTAHLGSLISDLVNYSRAGATEQAAEALDLPRFLNEIFDVIEKPQGMKLAIQSLPDDIVTFRAPLLLVFRNLVENAVKYHDRDKGKITVRGEDLGDRWSFSVEDDGPGIDPKFHDKILLPFRKLERRDRSLGNGMGLALVKKAVESNGGELAIVSNPLERPGTKFVFTWPKTNARAVAA